MTAEGIARNNEPTNAGQTNLWNTSQLDNRATRSGTGLRELESVGAAPSNQLCIPQNKSRASQKSGHRHVTEIAAATLLHRHIQATAIEVTSSNSKAA